MKKLLIILTIFFAPSVAFAYSNTWTNEGGTYYLTQVDGGTMPTTDYTFSCSGYTPEVVEDWSNQTVFGTVEPADSGFILHLTTEMGYGSGLRFTDDTHAFMDCGSTVTMTQVIDPSTIGLSGLVNTFSSGFETTVGFSPSNVVDWTGNNLIKLFIGSSMAFLYNIRMWLIVIAIVSMCLYFSYRFISFANFIRRR